MIGTIRKNEWYYKIGMTIIRSGIMLRSFEAFTCDPSDADVIIGKTKDKPPEGQGINVGSAVIQILENGWFFQSAARSETGIYVNNDYTRLRMVTADAENTDMADEFVIRIALECLFARRGYVSLHAACIALNGEAVAFCGPSGMGKSTRANAWMEAFGAELVSGDRPLIDVKRKEVLGVPWDGKEQCFRNVCYPLKSIYEVRRSEKTYVRTMGFEQRRLLLLRQCFMPMWDTETAVIQMTNISQLAAGIGMFRVFGGPTVDDARILKEMLEQGATLPEEKT